MTIGILGCGEVGGSLKKVVAEKYPVYCRDLGLDEIGDRKIDVLHICIPYSDKFVDVVVETIKELKPGLVLIEATVKVGTTREIAGKVECKIAHSFIRGIHPNLDKGIKTFTKMVGGINVESAEEANDYYQSLGLKTHCCVKPEESEAAKLWSTTYYALCIVLQKEVYKYCQEHDLDFGAVYEKSNFAYNWGYDRLGLPDFVRPVLKQVDGKIGGHCLISNCGILGGDVADFILEKNDEY